MTQSRGQEIFRAVMYQLREFIWMAVAIGVIIFICYTGYQALEHFNILSCK